MGSDTVSIIVPVFNGGEKFGRCLDSLKHCDPPPLEVIVVADGLSDGSWHLAKEQGFKTVVLDDNGGPARARNIGARSACGDILLFIDVDVLVQKDIIEHIQETFVQTKNLDAIIGSYDSNPTEKSFISQYRNLLHHFVHQTAREDASTFWGACGAIRRSTFLQEGGFNERYKTPSIEDIELGYRLKEKGCKIMLRKELQVTHMKRWTLISMLKTDIFSRSIPWTRLLLQKNCIVNDLNLSFSGRFSTVLIFLLLLSPLIWGTSSYNSILMVGCFSLLLALNGNFYRLLWRKHGLFFMLRALPLHWLYFFYSGISFLYTLINHTFTGLSTICKSSVHQSS